MIKKFKAIILAGFMCILFTTTAFAAKKNFAFSCIPKGGDGYTSSNPKSDSENYAYFTVTDANLIDKDKVKYVVTNSAHTKEVSDAITYIGKSKPYRQTLKYNSGYAKQGAKYCLKIRSYNYSLRISGRWNS